MKKTTTGAVVAAYEKGEVKLTVAEYAAFRQMPKSTEIYFQWVVDSKAPTAAYLDSQTAGIARDQKEGN